MKDCGCDKARKELEEYLHNELCSEDASDIRVHMENCADCSSELKVGLVLTEVVQRACDEAAPEELRLQVMTKLRSIQSTHTAPGGTV